MSAQPNDAGSATAYRPRTGDRRTFTETKLGFRTSEFMMMVVAAVAVLVATYVDTAAGTGSHSRFHS